MTSIGESTRPWRNSERNYSGSRVGVWRNDGQTTLSIKAGGFNSIAIVIKDHEAEDFALRLCPALEDRLEHLFRQMKAAQSALDLARNRLHAAATNEAPKGGKQYHEYSQWADEADAALAKIGGDA
jgi:hypothetical protein